MTAEKIKITFQDGKELSNSKLIIEQILTLDIFLSGATQPFKEHDDISITPTGDWLHIINNGIYHTDTQDHNSASLKNLVVKIQENPNQSIVGSTQSFTVKTSNSGYADKTIHYPITDLNGKSLKLSLDKFYVKTPTKNTIQNAPKITITTQIRDHARNGIPNLPVTIYVEDNSSLSKIDLFEQSGTPIAVDSDDVSEKIHLYTDNSGFLTFYAKPKVDTSVILELHNTVHGLRKQEKSDPLLIINPDLDYNQDPLLAPDILELNNDGILVPEEGQSTFHVKIPTYSGEDANDYILFFVDKKQTGYIHTISESMHKHTYELPCNIFPKSQDCYFSYVIARPSDNARYSYEQPVNYPGDLENKPSSTVKRKYILPTISSSSHTILSPGTLINENIISHYGTNGGYALFLTVDADSKDPNKVNPGDQVKINLYINSSNKGPQIIPFTLPIPSSAPGIYTSQGILGIPIDAIVDNDVYKNEYGTIYFEYYLNDSYSHYWNGEIDTVFPGQILSY